MSLQDHEAHKRVVRLFRNGRSQAVRIPKEWEFDGDEVVMRQLPDGKLMVMAAETAGLLDYLATAEPWTGGEFVQGDAHLAPLDEIDFK